MKPSELVEDCILECNKDAVLFSILDKMAKDIQHLKFLVKYICPSDVVKVYPIEEREWEK